MTLTMTVSFKTAERNFPTLVILSAAKDLGRR